jgi:son of sevenless-like protein
VTFFFFYVRAFTLIRIRQIQSHLYPELYADDDALEFVEGLLFKLIRKLLCQSPHGIPELEERANKILPYPIDLLANKQAMTVLRECCEGGGGGNVGGGLGQALIGADFLSSDHHQHLKKKNNLLVNLMQHCSLTMTPIVEKLQQLLCKELLLYKLDVQFAVYLCALLECIATDILNLVCKYVENMRHQQISLQDVQIAMNADNLLMDLFFGTIQVPVDDFFTVDLDEKLNEPCPTNCAQLTKDMIYKERQFLRDLTAIIKVFREPFIKSELVSDAQLEEIFSNITDLYEFAVNFLGSIEDTLEMNEKGGGMGACFEELAESLEFDVFERYAHDIIEENAAGKLQQLLNESKELAACLATGGQGILLCYKYVLPKLQICPIVHCLHYFEYAKLFKNLATDREDCECFEQCQGLMQPLKSELERITKGRNLKLYEGHLMLRGSGQGQGTNGYRKLKQICKQIDGYSANGNSDAQHCSSFVYEGLLYKLRKSDRKGRSERFCFLFDGILICCKPLPHSPNGIEYKFKAKYYVRRIEASDSEVDVNSFELWSSGNRELETFQAPSAEEKQIWLSNLLFLSQKSILERTLDSILAEEEKRNPLQLPCASVYPFAEPDSDENILWDTIDGKKVIKAATLCKLIERVTFHQTADLQLLRTFLTTYRSFCTPERLLQLLMERFNIPCVESDGERSREQLKRFKKEYLEPIQFRVINLIRHWTDEHYYDFDESMKLTLLEFLQQKVVKQRKHMKKFVEPVLKRLTRNPELGDERKVKFIAKSPPPIEWWITRDPTQFNLLTLHPLEFSRQLTLYEFDLYCAVRPFELMGGRWTKKDKHIHSPNLLKLMQHNSKIIYWIEKEIVECPNLEERQAIMLRLVEMLQVLHDLNNFNGIIEIISAIASASVHRLEHTIGSIPTKYRRLIDELNELNSCHFGKYKERLRSINPPCVPFFGIYLTQYLHLEEGNQDYLDGDKRLINFSKRRRIAEITTEIQQYQNQPYCMLPCGELRTFIESLDPMGDRSEKEFLDYLYQKSLEIEPRGCKQLMKAARKWPELPLKSPGIKPSGSLSASSACTLPTIMPLTPCSSTPTSPTLVSPKTPPATTVDSVAFLTDSAITSNHSTITSIPSLSGFATLPSRLHSSSASSRQQPPPLPPRINRCSTIHQRTASESSTTSNTTTSPSLLPALATPLSATFGAFNFNFSSTPLPSSVAPLPPPPPPRNPRLLDMPTDTMPPPLPPRGVSSTVGSSVAPPLPPPQTLPRHFQYNLTRRNSSFEASSPTYVVGNTTSAWTTHPSVAQRFSTSGSTIPLQSPLQPLPPTVAPLVANQPQLPPRTYKLHR